MRTAARTALVSRVTPVPTLLAAGLAGLAGALAVTAVHQTARYATPATAPRMDILGRRAIANLFRAAGARPPEPDTLQALALTGDVVSNTLYYALVATAPRGRATWTLGALLGAAAGLGAVVLPPKLGLGSAPSRRTPQTKAMAFGWYFLGGLVAAGVATLLDRGAPPSVRRAA